MARIMSIDYGQKRTGIAVSDPLQMIANGLTTVNTPQLLDFIADYLSKEQVERIVVGYPKQTNGEESENMKRITPFVNRLRKLYPDITVELYDERFTSVLAHRAIIESGISRKARQDKALVDKISATIILQDYLESKTKTLSPSPSLYGGGN
ncbi:MAG: Holliday junction resolvase RuvX [Bacteroidaceae bacterium]|nr:Holliday junction resolvase RuvX [Bacteroidaceae bacterium]